jgi:formimidoylglutamate deiminase
VVVFAELALLPEGWGRDVSVEIDESGTIVAVRTNSDPRGATPLPGALLPGMPNVHSHAFQYAMAGRAERRGPGGDDFWAWRRAMYDLAMKLNPESLYDIASAAYREMVIGGYTSVAEFHYLHRDPAGVWYADKSAMAKALVEAARDAGIAICMLPALYSQAAPDGTPLASEQRRFETSVDDVLEISRDVRSAFAGDRNVTVGVCAHSLRAARPKDFQALIDASPPGAPVHLHIAEQQREVDEIEAAFGARPIAWLLANFDVSSRWCLVHATRATAEELRGIARSGATVGLCPTTEANLGDGLFEFVGYAADAGSYGIGSDSNVTLAAADELRLLEYGQRLYHRRRVVAAAEGRSCGETLYAGAAAGGAPVSGFAAGAIAAGRRADLVTIQPGGHDAMSTEDVADRHIFSARISPVTPVRPLPARR